MLSALISAYVGTGCGGNGDSVENGGPVRDSSVSDSTASDAQLPNDGSVDAGIHREPMTLAAGSGHSCALRANGAVWCWGSNEKGQLGDGTTTNREVPVAVSGLNDAISITALGMHTCALRANGSVVCWGWNYRGQLGDGTAMDRSTPVGVVGLTDAVAVSMGTVHGCAVRASGAVVCWGDNDSGELGDGTNTNSAVPVAVKGLTDAVIIAAGEAYTCALRANGAVVCWGDGYLGELGDGQVGDGTAHGHYKLTPTPVIGLDDAIAISAGTSHACAIRRSGAAVCWGQDQYGQLGDGEPGTPYAARAVPVSVSGLNDATNISAGDQDSCAARAGGAAVCWGGNFDGNLGDGTSSTNSSTPVGVLNLALVSEIAAGDFHTCAKTNMGAIFCWGDNESGQLGIGRLADGGRLYANATPLEVQGF